MKPNGMTAIAVKSSSAFGETLAKATASREATMLPESPVDAAPVGRVNCESAVQGVVCGSGLKRDSDFSTAQCCRSPGDVDTHFDYVGIWGQGKIAVRSAPVARGSDVNENVSDAEKRLTGSVTRQYTDSPAGRIGGGAATIKLQTIGPRVFRQGILACRRIDTNVAASLLAAIKTSSKNATGLVTHSGRQLHAE